MAKQKYDVPEDFFAEENLKWGDDFPEPEPGVYLGEIQRAEVRKGRETESQNLNIGVQIVEGEFENAYVWEMFNLLQKDGETPGQKGILKLVTFMKGVGLIDVKEFEDTCKDAYGGVFEFMLDEEGQEELKKLLEGWRFGFAVKMRKDNNGKEKAAFDGEFGFCPQNEFDAFERRYKDRDGKKPGNSGRPSPKPKGKQGNLFGRKKQEAASEEWGG